MSEDGVDKKRLAVALQLLYFEAGAGLADSQAFEYGLTLLLHHLGRLGVAGLDPKLTGSVLEGDAKRTAGQLVRMLREKVTVSSAIEESIADALEARNHLIHRFLVDNTERITDAAQRPAVVQELRRLRARIQRADRLLRPFTEGLSGALDGLDAEATRTEAMTRFYPRENEPEGAG